MEGLLNTLKELSKKYEKLSDSLGLDDSEEEFYPDSDTAIDDGKSQAYWSVHNELDKLIKEYENYMNEFRDDKAYKKFIKTENGYEIVSFIIGYKHPLFKEIVNYFEYLKNKSKQTGYKEYD